MILKNVVWIISITVIVIVIFLSQRKINLATNASPDIIQTIIDLQRVVKDKDMEKAWRLYIGKVRKEKEGNDYDKFKDSEEWWYREFPQNVQAFINARLGKVRMITSNRAWVECESSDSLFTKGFYMVKEDGRWKYGNIQFYIQRTLKDIEFLSSAIKDYYATNGFIPYSLYELVPDYIKNLPLDPFSEEKKVYGYEITGDLSWKLYSVGIDSRDDLGLIERYTDPANDWVFSIGDIIVEVKI